MKWETVLGLEVHAELSTKTKIFCGCSTEFGAAPNTHVCPICAGMPGALPRLNKAVVERAMKLGIALECDIAPISKFDRKNYFYPDLPNAYQMSQFYAPFCKNGRINNIRIHQIHIEEDAGKLVHDPRIGQTYMDFNRCGIPLLEIVSSPDFCSTEPVSAAQEVIEYLERLREILLYLDISDCKMQEGSMRVDVNLSVRKIGEGFGARTETKNLNSLRAISRAIEYESARHIEILESGGVVTQETRRWDDEAGESYGMRSKENAQDYRYFPDPDLLYLEVDDLWLNKVKKCFPELAHKKRERYIRDYGMSATDAGIITSHKNIAALFESICEKSGEPKEAANLVTGEIMRLMNNNNTLPGELAVDAGKLAALIGLVVNGKINRSAYKEVVEEVFLRNIDPDKYIKEKNLFMASDSSAVEALVDAVVAENPNAVADYKDGKKKAFGFLIGQVMKQMGDAANPALIKDEMIKRLDK